MAEEDPESAAGCQSGMHTYTEWSARSKLTRHRWRGEDQYMFHCPWGDHWHCTDRPLEELLNDDAAAPEPNPLSPEHSDDRMHSDDSEPSRDAESVRRDEIIRTAERATFGEPDSDDLRSLDDAIRQAAAKTGRTIQATADLLRMEAIAGPYYRGDQFDGPEGGDAESVATTMTVRQLIEALRDLPPDYVVVAPEEAWLVPVRAPRVTGWQRDGREEPDLAIADEVVVSL